MTTQAIPPASPIYIPEKTILLPISGRVNVTDLRPIIATREFRLLAERKQLGLVYIGFPGGTHTRFEHSLGTAHLVRKILRHFRVETEDKDLSTAMVVYALLHDIGHGPLSHEIEPVLRVDHHDIGLERLAKMRPAIEQCADYDLVCRLYRKEHPLCRLVWDVNFGADKMDYIQRDAHHLGHELGLNLQSIIEYLQYQDGIIGVDDKCTDDIMRFQFSYLAMYSRFYYYKTAKILSRMLQRAMMEKITSGTAKSLIWDMTDTELMAWLSDHPLIQRLISLGPFKTYVAFKITPFEADERQGFRAIRVHGLSREEMHAWSQALQYPNQLLHCEQLIEDELGLPADSVVIAQPVQYDKIVPSDVPLYRVVNRKFDSLYRHNPSHHHSIQEMADRAFAIRVAMDITHFPQAQRFNFLSFFRHHLPLVS